MRIESRRGQNENIWNKTRYAIWKKRNSLQLFLADPLGLHVKDDL
jgi:hypothetical protein